MIRWASNSMSRFRAFLLIFVSVVTLACADGECVPFEGTEYNWQLVSEVKPGLPADQLRGKLGSPVTITSVGPNLSDWRFFYRCRRTSWVLVGPLKVKSGGATIHCETLIRVRADRVEQVLKDTGWLYE
jgi:outer membrane protein assembly factor BamE (lipoprotein component of BamABCDE complex)